jgi:hypothetical protein
MQMRDFVPPEIHDIGTAVEGVVEEANADRIIESKKRRILLRLRSVNAALALAIVLLSLLAVLVGCDNPKAPEAKPEPKPTEAITARAAFQKLFISARNYAADVKPFRIQSTPTTDANGQSGKSAIWTASFASTIQHGVKPFIWSGSTAPDAPSRGVSPGNEDTYNPSNASTQIFDVAFLKVDSDQAFTEAQKHGGDKELEKDPTTSVVYICDWDHNTNELIWHVIYGATPPLAHLSAWRNKIAIA